jgi:WD40 repeat protein
VEIDDANDVTAVEIADAQTIVEGTTDGYVRKLDLNANKITWRFRAHFQPVTSITVLRDGRILTGSLDGTASIWKRPATFFEKVSLLRERLLRT